MITTLTIEENKFILDRANQAYVQNNIHQMIVCQTKNISNVFNVISVNTHALHSRIVYKENINYHKNVNVRSLNLASILNCL